ncbi:MAG: UbiA family prenyltransferase [Planctomycetaceae bacterium]
MASTPAGRDLLSLARPALAPTAAADVLAAGALAGGAATGALLLAAVGSACLYMGAMVQNDLCDRERDMRHAPGRPLARRPELLPRAYALLAALFLGGLLLTALAGAALFGGLIFLSASAYNLGLKTRFPVDAVLMGVTRALNLGLGFAAAGLAIESFPWVYGGAYLLFIAGVTAASRIEDLGPEPTVRLGLLFAFAVQAGAILLLPLLAGLPLWPFALPAGLLAAALGAAYRGASRRETKRYVRRSLLLIFVLHAAVLAAHDRTEAIAPLLGCAAASFLLFALLAPPTSAPPAAPPPAAAG